MAVFPFVIFEYVEVLANIVGTKPVFWTFTLSLYLDLQGERGCWSLTTLIKACYFYSICFEIRSDRTRTL